MWPLPTFWASHLGRVSGMGCWVKAASRGGQTWALGGALCLLIARVKIAAFWESGNTRREVNRSCSFPGCLERRFSLALVQARRPVIKYNLDADFSAEGCAACNRCGQVECFVVMTSSSSSSSSLKLQCWGCMWSEEGPDWLATRVNVNKGRVSPDASALSGQLPLLFGGRLQASSHHDV